VRWLSWVLGLDFSDAEKSSNQCNFFLYGLIIEQLSSGRIIWTFFLRCRGGVRQEGNFVFMGIGNVLEDSVVVQALKMFATFFLDFSV
jgi:hypothetical protein